MNDCLFVTQNLISSASIFFRLSEFLAGNAKVGPVNGPGVLGFASDGPSLFLKSGAFLAVDW
jgi:hypothetical protein